MEREKLDLQINSPINLSLLFDDPIVGESKFGEYYMYGVKNGQDEYSFFAPLSVHEQLKDKPKGTKFQLTRTASQRGKKLVTDFEIKFLDNGIKKENDVKDKNDETEFFQLMLRCYSDATKLQAQYNSTNINQVAITLFIASVRTNGFNNYPKE